MVTAQRKFSKYMQCFKQAKRTLFLRIAQWHFRINGARFRFVNEAYRLQISNKNAIMNTEKITALLSYLVILIRLSPVNPTMSFKVD